MGESQSAVFLTTYVNAAFTDHEYVSFPDAPCPPELSGGTTIAQIAGGGLEAESEVYLRAEEAAAALRALGHGVWLDDELPAAVWGFGGDVDPVRATELGLKNLRRVSDLLIPATSKTTQLPTRSAAGNVRFRPAKSSGSSQVGRSGSAARTGSPAPAVGSGIP